MILATLAALALAGQSALPPAPPAPAQTIAQTPEHLALADTLVEVTKVGEQQMKVVPQIVAMMMPMMLRGNEAHAAELEAILTEEFARMFAERGKEMERAARDAYARNLTDQELRDLTAFYRTPSGQRLVDVLPTITAESMRDGQAIGQRAAAEAMPFIIERLRKANLKVPDRT